MGCRAFTSVSRFYLIDSSKEVRLNEYDVNLFDFNCSLMLDILSSIGPSRFLILILKILVPS